MAEKLIADQSKRYLMTLSSLRELLLKKCSDPNLATAIASLQDGDLASAVTESLMKMAGNAGSKANHALNHFNSHIVADEDGNSLDAEMLRDALGHHLSHYKAALKADDRDMADKHLGHTVNLLHLANRLNSTSGGKVKLGSGNDGYGKSGPTISPSSWEMNYTSDKRDPKGRLAQLPKNWGRDASGKENMFPDYRYLEMAPHPKSGKTEIGQHTDSAYPFHELTINDKYVPIEDVKHTPGKFQEHEFDKHPIVGHHDIEQKAYGDKHKESYLSQHHDFVNGPHAENWIKRQESKMEADPEAFFTAGSQPSSPILDKPNNSHASARPYHSTANHPDIWNKPAETPAATKPEPVKTTTLDLDAPDEEQPQANPAHKTIVEHFSKLGHTPESISNIAKIPIEHVHSLLGTKPAGDK